MIQIENDEVYGWEAAVRGMRNPMNSWDKSDSDSCDSWYDEECPKNCVHYCVCNENTAHLIVGENDLARMKKLVKAGTDHRKFLRMINVTVDITAPLYWWKEFDTYKVGTVRNSCSTMHKITAKEFTIDDFSHEHLDRFKEYVAYDEIHVYDCCAWLSTTVNQLNWLRKNISKRKTKILVANHSVVAIVI